ncbi:helix-turn-helix domain-containing protein [Rhizobium lentis]|uniref:helix-turn-helix domain-containing protein n=1 Tax=Rhizobium lentis TaxID=1138194 RepID=UPI001C832353|nr:XRE family transcriptional regulator [Rhizobium lentis]
MDDFPPILLRIAREFLGLSQDDVEVIFGTSRKTIQRAERGDKAVSSHLFAHLKLFYEKHGIEFVPPAGERGWGVFNVNVKDASTGLNNLGDIPLSRRKKTAEPARSGPMNASKNSNT